MLATSEPSISANYTESALVAALTVKLAGQLSAEQVSPSSIIWTDRGDELIIHLHSLQTSLKPGLVGLSFDIQADGVQQQTIVMLFTVGTTDGPKSLVSATEAVPRGPSALMARWGTVLQQTVWDALLSLGTDRAVAGKQLLIGVSSANNCLSFVTVQK